VVYNITINNKEVGYSAKLEVVVVSDNVAKVLTVENADKSVDVYSCYRLL